MFPPLPWRVAAELSDTAVIVIADADGRECARLHVDEALLPEPENYTTEMYDGLWQATVATAEAICAAINAEKEYTCCN